MELVISREGLNVVGRLDPDGEGRRTLKSMFAIYVAVKRRRASRVYVEAGGEECSVLCCECLC